MNPGPGSYDPRFLNTTSAVVAAYEPEEEQEVLGQVRQELQRNDVAYQEAGVVMKEEKKIRGAPEATVWGGELSTARHDVGAAVEKVLQLMAVTLRIL